MIDDSNKMMIVIANLLYKLKHCLFMCLNEE